MEKLKLSLKAKEVTNRLVGSKDSEKVGYIAAVDPQTGEAFYGKTVAEAAKEGRKRKKDSKAVFFFVRVGYPSVHVLKTVRLQGSPQCRIAGTSSLTAVPYDPRGQGFVLCKYL